MVDVLKIDSIANKIEYSLSKDYDEIKKVIEGLNEDEKVKLIIHLGAVVRNKNAIIREHKKITDAVKTIKEIEKIKNEDKVECDGLFRFWFLDEKNYEKVKYCPNCGSKDIIMPNDLIEWQCKKCGCWWSL